MFLYSRVSSPFTLQPPADLFIPTPTPLWREFSPLQLFIFDNHVVELSAFCTFHVLFTHRTSLCCYVKNKQYYYYFCAKGCTVTCFHHYLLSFIKLSELRRRGDNRNVQTLKWQQRGFEPWSNSIVSQPCYRHRSIFFKQACSTPRYSMSHLPRPRETPQAHTTTPT